MLTQTNPPNCNQPTFAVYSYCIVSCKPLWKLHAGKLSCVLTHFLFPQCTACQRVFDCLGEKICNDNHLKDSKLKFVQALANTILRNSHNFTSLTLLSINKS